MKILHRNKLFPIKLLKQEIIACISRSLFCTPTVLKRSIHIFRFALIVGILMSVSANSEADTIDLNLPFSVQGKSMWDTGTAFNYQKTDFIGLGWNKSISIGPEYFKLNGSTSGKVGLDYDFTLSTGSVDISYPVRSTIAFPGSAYPGDIISLSSSFVNLPNGTMKTLSPQATAKLELPLELFANVDGSIKLPLKDPIPFTLIPLIEFDKTYTFFNLSTENPSFSQELWGYGNIEAHIPVINTEATLSNGKFSANGSDDFITLTADVDKIATTLFPSIPSLGDTLTLSKATVSYDLLDVAASLDAGFKQSFEFTPTLKVKYTLENNSEFVTNVGDNPVNFSIPPDVGESLDVTATWFLENEFRNNTDFLLTPGINLSVLSGKASVFGYDLLDFGPVYSNGTSLPIPIDIFDKQFAIEGFQLFENNFSIEIVPAPSALILGALGLGTILSLMRKCRML